jgi:hypothetical protein
MPVFDFSTYFSGAPVELTEWPSYIHPFVRDRIKVALEAGCRCRHDQKRTASLVQRNGAAWLQCDACGHSLGNAMARKEHYGFSQYPSWRPEIKAAYDAQQRKHGEASLAKYIEEHRQPTLEERLNHYRARSAEYEQWCRTSPEWSAIRRKIFWRCRGHCEACLNGNATMVHHMTYTFGKLPPAWQLKAVCDDCHERLHDVDDGWCDVGMGRT